MDALRQTFRQYGGLFKSMSPSQRGTLIAVPLMIAAALAFLMFRDPTSNYIALSWGKVFTTEELMVAEQTLIDAGLNDFRRDGQRLMVPGGEAERYNAALLEGGSLPSNYGEELERQLDKQSVFTSERQAKSYRDLALKNELRRIIRAIPDVEDADVVWARGEPARWPNRGGKVTATVSVRLRRGHEVSTSMVQSLRTAVASMVPDLKTADVVVLDLNSGTSHVPGRDGDPFDNSLLARIREFTQSYQQKIGDALSHIPGVLVTVNVDVDNLKSHVERSQKLNPKEQLSLYQIEQSRNENSRQQPTRAEPGANSNRPRELNLAAGQERTRSFTETNAESVTLASFSVTDREFIAAMPKAVQVSIKIPDDYYRAIALKQGLKEGETDEERAEFRKAVEAIRTEEERKAKATASVLIPSGSPEEAVAVSSFVPIDPVEPEIEASVVDSVGSAVSQWGSAVGLALFALWALWMLNKSTPRLPEVEPAPAGPMALKAVHVEEDEEQEPAIDNTRRDHLQAMVRDNPEVAAAVLGKWIRAGKG